MPFADVSLPAVFMPPTKSGKAAIYNPRASKYFHASGSGSSRLTQPPSMIQLPPIPSNVSHSHSFITFMLNLEPRLLNFCWAQRESGAYTMRTQRLNILLDTFRDYRSSISLMWPRTFVGLEATSGCLTATCPASSSVRARSRPPTHMLQVLTQRPP